MTSLLRYKYIENAERGETRVMQDRHRCLLAGLLVLDSFGLGLGAVLPFRFNAETPLATLGDA